MATTLVTILQGVKVVSGQKQSFRPTTVEFKIDEGHFVIPNEQKKASWKEILKATNKDFDSPDKKVAAAKLKKWLEIP